METSRSELRASGYQRDLGSDVDLGGALRDHHRWLMLGVIFYVYYAAYVATALRNMVLRLPPPSIFSGADLLAGAWFVGLTITSVLLAVIEVALSGFAVARRTYKAYSRLSKSPARYVRKAGFGFGLALVLASLSVYVLKWTVHFEFRQFLGVPGELVVSLGLLAGGLVVWAFEGVWGKRYGLLIIQIYLLAILLDAETLRGSLIYYGIGLFMIATFWWWSRELAAAKGLSRSPVYQGKEENAFAMLVEMRANTLYILIGYLVFLPLLSGIIVAERVKSADPIWGDWTRIQGTERVVRILQGQPDSETVTTGDPENVEEYWFFGSWNQYVLGVDKPTKSISFIQMGTSRRGEKEPIGSTPRETDGAGG